MNTIEMQSITAMAHLKSCILYFMDLSEQCGYSVEAQVRGQRSWIILILTSSPVQVVPFDQAAFHRQADHARPE
jgi:GTP1/Obg family GTP-binding protein